MHSYSRSLLTAGLTVVTALVLLKPIATRVHPVLTVAAIAKAAAMLDTVALLLLLLALTAAATTITTIIATASLPLNQRNLNVHTL